MEFPAWQERRWQGLLMMHQAPASPTSLVKQHPEYVVLLADDELGILEYFKPALTTDTLSCITAGSLGEAVEVLRKGKVDLLILLPRRP